MKRALSLMLTLCMLLTMLPGGVAEEVFEEQFAEDSFDESFTEETFSQEDAETLDVAEDLPEAAFFEEMPDAEPFEELTENGFAAEDAFAEDNFDEDSFGEETFEEDLFEDAPAAADAEELTIPVEEEISAAESTEVIAEEEQFAEEPVEDAAEAEQPAEDTQEILIASGLDDRSVVSLATDQTKGDSSAFADNAKTYWKVAPTVNVIQTKKDGALVDGQIKIRWVSEWNVDKTVLPANVKYYVYRVDPVTGVATQVKTAKAKAISFTQDGRKVSGTGSAVTLNGIKGDEIFYVRAEKITDGKEVYGLSSDMVYLSDRLPGFENGLWKTVTIESLSEYTDKRDGDGNLSLTRLKAVWNCGGITSREAAEELNFIVKLTYQDKDGNRKGSVKVIKDITYERNSEGDFAGFAIEQTEEEVEEYTDLGATHVKLTVQPKKNGVKGSVFPKTIQLSSDGTAYKKLISLNGVQTSDSEVKLLINPNRLTHQYLIKGLLTDEKLMVKQDAGTIYPKNPADKSCIRSIEFAYRTADGEYLWSLRNDGNHYETDYSGNPELVKQRGAARIEVRAMTQEAANITVTVQPIKKTSTKAIKGEVHTVTIPMVNSWRAKPVITSLTQTGIRQATLCFTQNQNQVKPTAFIIYGFKSKAVVRVKDGELTLPAATTGITAVETIKQEDGTYLYKITGAVAAEGEHSFSVKPQLTVDGTKLSGEVSDEATLDVLLKTKTGVLKLMLGPWKDDGSGETGSVTVTFASIQPKKNVEKFVISLADADSFAGADAYKKKMTLTYKQAKDDDGNGFYDGLYHAVFTGVQKGKTYSVLAETFTVDAGRLVDKTLSLVYGESPKDEKLAEKPDVSALPEKINAAANGKDAAGNAVYIGTQVDFAELLDEGDYDLSIDDTVRQFISVPTEAVTHIEAGEHKVRLARVDRETGEVGTWSDAFTLTVYEDLEAVSLKSAADSILIVGTIVLLPEVKGGSGEYAYKLSVSVNAETASEAQGLEIPAQNKGTYTITTEVTDVNLTKDGVPLGAGFAESVTVEVGDTFTVGDLTYRLKEEDPTKVMVSAYSGSDAEVIVPATATEEASGRSFAVTEIGEKAFYENASLTAITLPNAIEVIGVSAFEGCTSLSTMNSVDNP